MVVLAAMDTIKKIEGTVLLLMKESNEALKLERTTNSYVRTNQQSLSHAIYNPSVIQCKKVQTSSPFSHHLCGPTFTIEIEKEFCYVLVLASLITLDKPSERIKPTTILYLLTKLWNMEIYLFPV